MTYYTYVLKSLKDKKLYVGSTDNLKRRLFEHNSGINKSTKYRKPFKIVYYEEYNNLKDARKREILFKKSHSILYKAAGWKDLHK